MGCKQGVAYLQSAGQLDAFAYDRSRCKKILTMLRLLASLRRMTFGTTILEQEQIIENRWLLNNIG
jgi:hypothetical protein